MQRHASLFLAPITTALLLAGCRDSGGSTSTASESATATNEPTVGDMLVGGEQLPSCTMTSEGSLFEGAITQLQKLKSTLP